MKIDPNKLDITTGRNRKVEGMTYFEAKEIWFNHLRERRKIIVRENNIVVDGMVRVTAAKILGINEIEVEVLKR